MASGALSEVLRHLQRTVLPRALRERTDAELVESFFAEGDQTAAEALVRRHGPMVLAVCRRVLSNEQDAADAFQATFLVFARKAATVMPRHLIGNWLYGVACRTARKAKGSALRRGVHERRAAAPQETLPQDLHDDTLALLDREIERLPDKYRVPVVLCELQGQSRKDVSRQLRIPEGTLSSRLAQARKILSQRLTRRGVALSSGVLAVLLSQHAASAAVPAALLAPTVAATTLYAAGQATAGVVSAKVAALTEGVLRAMFIAKLKLASVMVFAVSLLGAVCFAFSQNSADAADQTTPRLTQSATSLEFAYIAGDKKDEKDKDDGDKNNKDDGDKGNKDDKDQNNKDDGDKGNKDDKDQNNRDDGQKNDKDDPKKTAAISVVEPLVAAETLILAQAETSRLTASVDVPIESPRRR